MYFVKREYELKVKKKKIKYKDDILADLESSGKNSKYFWKIIKKAFSGSDLKKTF